MNITKQELESIEIPANFVLVKPLFNDNPVTSDNMDWFVNTEFTPGKFAQTTCEVVKVCDVLTPFRDNKGRTSDGGVNWIVPITIQPGDIALCYFFPIVNALEGTYERHRTYTNGRRVDVDGVVHIFLKYDEVFCAKRGTEIITVNGFNIAKRLTAKYDSQGVLLPETMQIPSDNYAEIIYPAVPVIEYVEEKFAGERVSEGVNMLNKGDIVRCNPKMVIETEYSLKRAFFNDVYFRIQQKDIYTVLSEQLCEY